MKRIWIVLALMSVAVAFIFLFAQKQDYKLIRKFLMEVPEVSNVEASECWNEELFKLLEQKNYIVVDVIGTLDSDIQSRILEHLRNPIHDGIDVEKIYHDIKASRPQATSVINAVFDAMQNSVITLDLEGETYVTYPLIFNTSEDTIKSFLTKMYNDKLYEDYDFLQKHCSPELLKKLQYAYTYDSDGPAYATWLFRSGQQDSKPGADAKTMMLDIKADGDWYVYTALDMGWKFTNRIKVTCPDGKIIIKDMDLTAEWAKAFVRNSYLYHWHETQNVDSTVMAFCELAKHLMPDIQLDPSAIKAYIMSAEKENAMEGEGEDLLNIVTAGKYYTPLCRCDIYPYMKEQMSEDTLAAFYNVYDSWKTDLKTALRTIKDKCYREISLELYGNDHDIIGNREIVRYLIKAEK